MRIPRKVVLFSATVCLLALLPASSAFAYSAGEKKSEKRQNARIGKLSKDLTAAKGSLGALAGLPAKLDGVDTRLKTIEAAAPQIVKGLSDLSDAAKGLKAGLEQASAGLNGLKTLATSQEYGEAQVFIGATPVAGAFLVTPDIPDSVQQAQVQQTYIATGAGTINVQVAVRSAESDGTGSSLPAAHCRVTVIGPGGTTATTSKPNPALGGAPFWPIDKKSVLTSTDPANAGFPFGPKTSGADADNLVNLTDISGTGNATEPLGGGSAAATAAAGQSFSVQLDCVDVSASAEDPSA
jgi:hypothetical protein